MILLSHPTGNTFVRALLEAFERERLPYQFYTTLAFDPQTSWAKLLPPPLRNLLARRSFPAPSIRCQTRPSRELARLLSSRLGLRHLTQPPNGPCGAQAVYEDLDRFVARALPKPGPDSTAAAQLVYAYEDCAAATFAAAAQTGTRRCYELPIAYHETSQRLLREEAERWPEWMPTLPAIHDSSAKFERKSRELELADAVICPSQFVLRSLPETVRSRKPCVVAPFGSPTPAPPAHHHAENKRGPLRVLFAGTLSQRKGLADLFQAMRLARRKDVELVVMGSLLQPLEFYRAIYHPFRYETPRSHAQVLGLMRQCDVLALPSIVEGRALVQQEALSCGLPLIVTPNAGGEDLVDPGETGFLVPIRSPEAIAERIHWFADHRAALPEMRRLARAKAARYTWTDYTQTILQVIRQGDLLAEPSRAAA